MKYEEYTNKNLENLKSTLSRKSNPYLVRQAMKEEERARLVHFYLSDFQRYQHQQGILLLENSQNTIRLYDKRRSTGSLSVHESEFLALITGVKHKNLQRILSLMTMERLKLTLNR